MFILIRCNPLHIIDPHKKKTRERTVLERGNLVRFDEWKWEFPNIRKLFQLENFIQLNCIKWKSKLKIEIKNKIKIEIKIEMEIEIKTTLY